MPFYSNFLTEEDEDNNSLTFLRQQILIAYDLKQIEMEEIETGLLTELEKNVISYNKLIIYGWNIYKKLHSLKRFDSMEGIWSKRSINGI